MMIFLQKQVERQLKPAVNEGKRLFKSSNVLKTSLFKETYTGSSVVRAFGF